MAFNKGGYWSMARKLFLGLCLAATMLMAGCGGGTGISTPPANGGGAPDAPALTASPTSVNFGSVGDGTSQTSPVVLTNGSTSGQSISVSKLDVTGSGFSLASAIALPTTIAAGQTLTVPLKFSPAAPGAATGTLTVTSDASNTSLPVALAGTGLGTGQMGVTPTSLDFGTVFVGDSSTLSGALVAGPSSITVSAANFDQPDYSIGGVTFPVTLNPGQSLTYTITFSPQSPTTESGSVSFVSDASDSPAIQTLSGTGQQKLTGPPPGAIAADFFNLNSGNFLTPWPNQLGVKMSVWRTLGTITRWSDLETCDGGSDPTNPCYNWTGLDKWIGQAAANGQDVLYTAYYTPAWASSNPTGVCQANGPGGCYPPNDVETGDNHWKQFLTALYTHTATTPGLEKIKYWECWNEPNIIQEYNNNSSDPAVALSDLNTMCSDLRSTIKALDPNTKFTTPAPANAGASVKWMTKWVNAGYANYADYIAFHGYVCIGKGTCTANSAETIDSIILDPLKAFIATTQGTSNDVTAKPLWDTEGSDDAGNIPIMDPDLHAAFYARYTLVQQSEGVAHFAYWGYDFGNGMTLVNNPGTKSATLNPAGIAWQQIFNWTVGSAYSTPCANTSGTIWQCTLTDGSTSSLLVWDTSQSCKNGVCTTTNFDAPTGYTKYTDLTGAVRDITDHIVPIGAKPVMLQ
jgi:Abnormal spindle-like microcephaly-assoc'd, ASPM-SPD-2-Hydin